MNFLIRYLATFAIKKAAIQARNKQFCKLNEAKSIGVVFEATHPEEFELAKKFIQELKTYCKNVQAIGYVDLKISPNYAYIKTDIDLFNKKELIQFYKPKSPYIRTFIEDEKDLLIDLNLKQQIPLRYIMAASRAKCKVGMHLPENEFLLDILIACVPEKGMDFYLKQLIKYLATI